MKSLLTYSLCADTYTTKDRKQTSNTLQKKYSGYFDSKVIFFWSKRGLDILEWVHARNLDFECQINKQAGYFK